MKSQKIPIWFTLSFAHTKTFRPLPHLPSCQVSVRSSGVKHFESLVCSYLSASNQLICLSADAKALDEPRVMIRTNSELDMLAEKAALLGRREADEEPNSPMEERRSRSPTSVQSAARPPTPPSDLIRDTDPLSVTSPMYDPAQTEFRPQPLSEKARGKMRATDSAASLPSLIGEGPEIPDEELMKVASSGVGPNGYIPTQDWVSSWQKGCGAYPLRSSYR